jgi:hypothetical protein
MIHDHEAASLVKEDFAYFYEDQCQEVPKKIDFTVDVLYSGKLSTVFLGVMLAFS